MDKIRDIIEKKIKERNFSLLDSNIGINLIRQIIRTYEQTNGIKRQASNSDELDKKEAELLLVMAPTGAGKDTLVAKLNYQNPEKNYIELNMDIFRHYFPLFIKDKLQDRGFAESTNEFSYEIYTIIQEILLTEFPGTNIIITGTLRQTDWIEDVIKKFKSDKKTNYKVKLIALAVPKKESAISTIQRYIGIVDSQKDNDDIKFSRYTSMKYHNETFDKFPENFQYFENLFLEQQGELIDCIEVYKRSNDVSNLSEDTKIYSSDLENNDRTALDAIMELREKDYKISFDEFDIITKKIIRNKEYLKNQGVLTEIIRNLAVILDYPKIIERLDKINESTKLNSISLDD